MFTTAINKIINLVIITLQFLSIDATWKNYFTQMDVIAYLNEVFNSDIINKGTLLLGKINNL